MSCSWIVIPYGSSFMIWKSISFKSGYTCKHDIIHEIKYGYEKVGYFLGI